MTEVSDFFCSSLSRFCFFIISANEKAKSLLWFSKAVGSSGFLSGGRVTFLTTVIGLCDASFLEEACDDAGFAGAFFAAGLAFAGADALGGALAADGFFAAGFATAFFAAGFAAGFFDLVLIRFPLKVVLLDARRIRWTFQPEP